MKRKKLGEILQDRGQISAGDLQKLFKEQEGKVVRLGELILERGLVDKPSLVKALEEVSRVPYLDCSTIQCDTRSPIHSQVHGGSPGCSSRPSGTEPGWSWSWRSRRT